WRCIFGIEWPCHQEPRRHAEGFADAINSRLKNGAPRVALQNQAGNSVFGQTARPQAEDVMAWRDDKARATLIREAAGSVQPGKTPRAFAELLFSQTNVEDLVNYDAASLAFLAEQAWEHVQRRTAGSADIRVINPMMPDGREISVLEVLN